MFLTVSADRAMRKRDFSIGTGGNEKGDATKGVSLRDFIPWKNIGIVWSDPAMPIFSVPGAVRLLR